MIIKTAKFIKGIVGTDDVLDDPYPQIAFIGRSNAGKSSLINSLTNQKGLARISATPGRTQEINLFFINHNTYFLDLPGYGFAKVSKADKEWLRKVVQWYLFRSEYKQKKVVLVLDANIGPTEKDEAMIAELEQHDKDVIIIANKIDKIKKADYAEKLARVKVWAGPHKVIPYSTKKRIGVHDLINAVLQ